MNAPPHHHNRHARELTMKKSRKPIRTEKRHMGFIVFADVEEKKKDRVTGEETVVSVRKPVSGSFSSMDAAQTFKEMYERTFGKPAYPTETIVERNIYA